MTIGDVPQAAGAPVLREETLTLGAYTIHRVPDLDAVAWPLAALLGSITDEDLERVGPDIPATHLDGRTRSLVLSFNVFLVLGPGCRVLIDAGVGNDKERPDRLPWHRRHGPFLERLAALDLQPEDVTHVINTHLHADHVGWNTRLLDGAWRPTFPRARYVVPKREFDHWATRQKADPDSAVLHGAFADSVLPVQEAGQMDLVDLPAEPLPGFRLDPAYGHAPGMATVTLRSDGAEIVFAADAIHHSLQFGLPERSSNFCFDPEEAARTRRALLERLAGSGAIIAPYHLPPPTFGRVERRGEAFVFRPLERDPD